MVDSLGRYWLNLHARARDIDADQALLGALGVAAFAYPHQIYNVRRMVTEGFNDDFRPNARCIAHGDKNRLHAGLLMSINSCAKPDCAAKCAATAGAP